MQNMFSKMQFSVCLLLSILIFGSDVVCAEQGDTEQVQSLQSANVFWQEAKVHVAQGDLSNAEVFIKKAMAATPLSSEQGVGFYSALVAKLSGLLKKQGRFDEAANAVSSAIAEQTRVGGAETQMSALLYIELAETKLNSWDDFTLALDKAKNIAEKIFRSNPNSGIAFFDRIANRYVMAGRYIDAEITLRRAISLAESNGMGRYVRNTKNHLSMVLSTQGDTAGAIGVINGLLAEDFDPILAINLGQIYVVSGDYEKAIDVLKKVMAESPSLPTAAKISAYTMLALSYQKLPQKEVAEKIFLNSLSFGRECEKINVSFLTKEQKEKNLSIRVANERYANFLFEQARYVEARKLYRRSLECFRINGDMESANAMYSLVGLMWSEYKLGNKNDARNYALSAYGLLNNPVVRRVLVEAKRHRDDDVVGSSGLISSLFRYFYTVKDGEEDVAKCFYLSQLMTYGDVSRIFGLMKSRYAAGDGELSRLIKIQQDIELSLSSMQDPAIGKSDAESSHADNSIESTRKKLLLDLSNVQSEISKKFPSFTVNFDFSPLAILEVKARLKSQDALLYYQLDDESGYVWVITKDTAKVLPLKVGRSQLERVIQRIRHTLQPVETESGLQVRPFNLALTNSVYANIFQPIEPFLSGKKHIYLVADGPLISLPFSILTPTTSSSIAENKGEYKSIDWLLNYYAFTTLPSVSVLSQPEMKEPELGLRLPFIGFGNPTFGADGKADPISMNDGLGDARIRGGSVLGKLEFSPLPETETEVREMARLFGEGSAVLVGREASESNANSLDMAKYDVITFATHAVTSGEFNEYSEPGLLLATPSTVNSLDDGFLSSSEVMKLKLHAELVVLSACNTASSDGKSGASGLSGLAKSFFFAGTKSLLVSHWPVESSSAYMLTTGMFQKIKQLPSMSKAEALRQSMLDLASAPGFSHPYFWAPFVLTGDAK